MRQDRPSIRLRQRYQQQIHARAVIDDAEDEMLHSQRMGFARAIHTPAQIGPGVAWKTIARRKAHRLHVGNVAAPTGRRCSGTPSYPGGHAGA